MILMSYRNEPKPAGIWKAGNQPVVSFSKCSVVIAACANALKHVELIEVKSFN